MSSGIPADIASNRSAVRVDPFCIEQLEIHRLEESLEWRKCMVRKVLVVNRVEEQLLNDVNEVRHFEHEYTFVGQKHLDGTSEADEIFGVCEHIVGRNQIGTAARLLQFLRQLDGKEGFERRHTRRHGFCHDFFGRIDPKYLIYSTSLELLE